MIPELDIDIGYSACKILFNNEFYKVATSISFANDVGIDFGENNVYEFEGEKYYVGEAASDESFTTTEFSFLQKFGPLILFHIIKKLGIQGDVLLKTGLALSDWNKREDFRQRIESITVNGETINTNARVVAPQGSGCYNTYIVENNLTENHPNSMSVIDIGYRTINFLYFEKGKPQQNKMKGFPGHGVVSIIKTFTNQLEQKTGMNFSEQEALKIFMSGSFSLGGVQQEEITLLIADLKSKFIQKLMNSVLTSEKKILMLSDAVLIAGGGSYLIRDVGMPPNTVWNKQPAEFSNVYGYSLIK